MFKLYVAANKEHNLNKIGITQGDPNGRIDDYLSKHPEVPQDGWGRTKSFDLDTDDYNEARKVEREAHQRLIDQDRRPHCENGRGAREVFEGDPKGIYFGVVKVVTGSNLHVPKSKK